MTSSAGLVTQELDNGLRVAVAPDHTAPAVAVNLWYDVGSRHERRDRTGLAHLFEHLMFQGSANVASGEHFELLEACGADLNATTHFERTNYFETVPAGAVDLALWLEADRMGGLLAALSQENLDNQRDVVKNERRERVDNQPYGDAWQNLFELAYPVDSGYHHPTIGSMADLDATTLDECADFFRTHYRPSNAVLSIVGDIDHEAAFDAVHRYFGDLPATAAPVQPDAEDHGSIQDPQRRVLDAPVPAPAWYSMWRTPRDGLAAADATDLALQVLGGGRASRLTTRLVDVERLASDVHAFTERQARGDSGAIVIVRGLTDCDRERVDAVLDEELTRFAEEGPTEPELAHALALAERRRLDETADFGGRADAYSRHACLFGDAAGADLGIDRLRSLTTDDVHRAARSLVPGHCARVVYPAHDRRTSS